MRRTMSVGSIRQAVGHLVVASAIGLLALPLIFSSSPDVGSPQAWLWLGASAVIGAWLFVPAPVVVRALARVLVRVPVSSRLQVPSERSRFQVSQRLVAIGYVVVLQAVVRRPLVGALGAAAEPLIVEAIFAVIALLVLLAMLALLHQVGRPLVEGLATFALDTILATSGSEVSVPLAHTRSRISLVAQGTPTILAPAETVAQPTVAARTESALTRQAGQRGKLA